MEGVQPLSFPFIWASVAFVLEQDWLSSACPIGAGLRGAAGGVADPATFAGGRVWQSAAGLDAGVRGLPGLTLDTGMCQVYFLPISSCRPIEAGSLGLGRLRVCAYVAFGGG